MHRFIFALLVGLGFLGSGSVILAQDSELCALTPFHIEGQAHSLIGQGPQREMVAKLRPAAAIQQAVEPTPLDLNALGLNYDTASPSPRSISIIIVDDFSSPTTLGPSHGAYVQAFFQQLLAGVQYAHPIYTVDIADAGFTASGILSRLANVVPEALANGGVVLNMSFAFIPCQSSNVMVGDEAFNFDVLKGLLSEPPEGGFSLADYVGEAGALTLLTEGANTGSALQNTIQQWADQENFIAVASAGNYANLQREPFAPASWGGVIAVSAFIDYDPSVFEWMSPSATDPSVSNSGDVAAMGGWYSLGDLNGNGTPDSGAGTSFAAPLVSVAAAEYLADPSSVWTNFTTTMEQCSAGGGYSYYVIDNVVAGIC